MLRICMQHHSGDTTEVQKSLGIHKPAIYIKYSCVKKARNEFWDVGKYI